jgi:hypothetical protein
MITMYSTVEPRPKRIVERRDKNGFFLACKMSDIKQGDVFRLWENPVTPVMFDGEHHMLAIDDARKAKDGDGWIVTMEPLAK